MRASVWLLAFVSAVAMAADTTTALTDLPSLSTATGDSSSADSTAAATSGTSATSAKSTATDKSSASATATGASSTKDASSTTDGSSTTGASSTADASSTTGTATGTSSNTVFHLTGLPTIAGAGIPTLVIPYTAGAPFMQKSAYPEGTVFICVGAVLAFLGVCVLTWRAMVAYSISRSVKRAALASIMASDTKAPAWLSSGTAVKKGPGGKLYKQPTDASSLSLEALNSDGRKADPYAGHRVSAVPTRKEQKRDPSALFFSPTAGGLPGANAPPMAGLSSNTQNRSSTYLPAGYYASSSAQATGGAAPYSRTSPPTSPGDRPASSYLRAGREDARNRSSYVSTTNRNSAALLSPAYNPGGPSPLYAQPSTSSLAVGYGANEENLPGSRAPSQYFDDVLENHGNGPRERF